MHFVAETFCLQNSDRLGAWQHSGYSARALRVLAIAARPMSKLLFLGTETLATVEKLSRAVPFHKVFTVVWGLQSKNSLRYDESNDDALGSASSACACAVSLVFRHRPVVDIASHRKDHHGPEVRGLPQAAAFDRPCGIHRS